MAKFLNKIKKQNKQKQKNKKPEKAPPKVPKSAPKLKLKRKGGLSYLRDKRKYNIKKSRLVGPRIDKPRGFGRKITTLNKLHYNAQMYRHREKPITMEQIFEGYKF